MSDTRKLGNDELLNRLSRNIEQWDASPYYLPEEDAIDLERFLTDHGADELKREMESLYGTPLNHRFWSSFLAYHRLKRAREELKAHDALQEEKKRYYLAVVEEEKEAGRKWLKEWFHQLRRQQIKVLPGGAGKDPDDR